MKKSDRAKENPMFCLSASFFT